MTWLIEYDSPCLAGVAAVASWVAAAGAAGSSVLGAAGAGSDDRELVDMNQDWLPSVAGLLETNRGPLTGGTILGCSGRLLRGSRNRFSRLSRLGFRCSISSSWCSRCSGRSISGSGSRSSSWGSALSRSGRLSGCSFSSRSGSSLSRLCFRFLLGFLLLLATENVLQALLHLGEGIRS